MRRKKLYTVVYRHGGPARFQWVKMLWEGNREDAAKYVEEITRAGYRALIVEAERANSAIPTTWSAQDSCEDVVDHGNGWYGMKNFLQPQDPKEKQS